MKKDLYVLWKSTTVNGIDREKTERDVFELKKPGDDERVGVFLFSKADKSRIEDVGFFTSRHAPFKRSLFVQF